ncbi:hypothetical protein NliqN6_2198 [Naganishia liquefaciens]|uniref:Arrestin C-terminal-like domain-containing protein n=1 Tax=Naganishia liquefaciens TaxID=104408 RepID=A0A8H3YFK8_9TREE|nr:hypothetical protein NliqN6_2198 [Naganishia liquefaciens]
MSHNVKLNFQPLPNLPYVQGYPGIIGSAHRRPPAVQGLLEVRVGKEQIKAKQIQIEFIQVEHLPGSTQVVASPIGSPINVWTAANGSDWEYATNADYRFYFVIPGNLPGSCELKQKGGAIRYEIQANFFHKPKSGLLRKETTPITQAIKPIYIGKMELLPAWPIYNIPEVRQSLLEEVELIVTRPYTAFGPGDRIEVHATLRSSRPKPLKVRSFVLTLHEILSIRLPTQKGIKQNAMTRTRIVHEAKVSINEKIARSEDMRRTIPMIVPAGLVANTIRNGRAIELQYELSVKAVMEGMGDPKVEHLHCILGTVPRARSFDIVNQIGYVESLCPAPPGGRPASIRSNSTFAASSSGLQYGVPASLYNSPAMSPPPALTTPPALQNRPSYHGNSLYTTAPGIDLGPIRSRPQSSFVNRPVSADASSLYSRRQSQSEISSIRDPRADYLPVHRLVERPQSHMPYVGSPNEPLHQSPDLRRMTYLGVGAHQYPTTTRSSLSLERPEGPARMNSYSSQVASVRSRDVDSPATPSVAKPSENRLSTDNKSVYIPPSPRPISFVHTDAGRVILTETGQPVVEAGGSRADSRAGMTSDQARWAAAESEKQRLYIEARRRAALTQLAGGGELASMGLDEAPQEEPPSYSPRDPANQQQQSATSTSILITSPSTQGAPVLQGQAYSTATSPLASASPIVLSIPSGVGLGIRGSTDAHDFDTETRETPNASSTSADEKERMRLFFEQQDRMQDISSRPSASSLGHTSGNSSCIAAPPTTAHGTRSSEFLSAEIEKDIMRKRYEAATRAVSAGGHGGSSSRRSSYQHDSPRQSSISSSHDYSHSGHYAYQSARQEKEEVQESYEDGVNAIAALRVEAVPRQQTELYRSAQDEKDLMRQRYQEAVSTTERQNSESSTNTIPASSLRLKPIALSSTAGSSRNPSQEVSVVPDNDRSPQTETSYLTASQEKEQMRQRYEAAVRAAQNSTAARSADRSSSHDHKSQSEGNDYDYQKQSQVRSQARESESSTPGPPVLPPKPVGIDQYKAILSSPIEEAGNPFLYMGGGMMPMYPTMFPGPIAGIDYAQAANCYYPQARGETQPER